MRMVTIENYLESPQFLKQLLDNFSGRLRFQHDFSKELVKYFIESHQDSLSRLSVNTNKGRVSESLPSHVDSKYHVDNGFNEELPIKEYNLESGLKTNWLYITYFHLFIYLFLRYYWINDNETHTMSHSSSEKRIISKYKRTGYARQFINQKGFGQGMGATNALHKTGWSKFSLGMKLEIYQKVIQFMTVKPISQFFSVLNGCLLACMIHSRFKILDSCRANTQKCSYQF